MMPNPLSRSCSSTRTGCEQWAQITAPIPPVQDIPVTQDTLARFMTNVPDELKVYGDVFASLPHEILSSGLDIKKEDDQTPSEP